MQHPAGTDCRQPEHNTEGAYGKTANMNKWIHVGVTFSSIASTAVFGDIL
jgi:hypothetical protein